MLKKVLYSVIGVIALFIVLVIAIGSSNPQPSKQAQEVAIAQTDSSSTSNNTVAAPISTPKATTNTAEASHSLSLVTEPHDGVAPVISMINSANKSVDLVMYELEDTQVEAALAAAQARGVSVRVLLNGGYYGKPDSSNPNAAAYTYLQGKNVPVKWTPSYFALTHQKTLVVDGDDALIMTFNLTPQYYASSRDFGINDPDIADVSAIETTFNADWNDTKITAPQGDDLVWSPDSQSEIVSLIAGAKQSLLVYNEEMNDTAVTNALEAAAQRGVNVEVDMTYDSSWKSSFQVLVASGVHVRTYAASASLYIHAKMILVDGSKVFVGSENFSPTSLNNNRELGAVLTNSAILSSLVATFNADWQNATPFASSDTQTTTQTTTATTPASATAAYYTSSYGTAKYYYPAPCSAWQGLSKSYLVSFPSLQALLAKYPNETLSPQCQ